MAGRQQVLRAGLTVRCERRTWLHGTSIQHVLSERFRGSLWLLQEAGRRGDGAVSGRGTVYHARCGIEFHRHHREAPGGKHAFDALAPLSDEDLIREITIRTGPHSVMQAINRQIAHYSYHVGQIVYLAKHFAGSKWQSLTIPKNNSAEFNARVATGEISQR